MHRIVVPMCLASCAGTDFLEPDGDASTPADESVFVERPPATNGTTAATPPAVDKDEPIEVIGFSFVDDNVAGMSFPGSPWLTIDEQAAWMAGQGITLLVSLTEIAVDATPHTQVGIDILHLPIPDFEAPTHEQQRQLVEAIRQRVALGEKVGVHCLAGLGRTGTMLATWLVSEGQSAADAIDDVRAQRPGSIETAVQEDAVTRFERRTAP